VFRQFSEEVIAATTVVAAGAILAMLAGNYSALKKRVISEFGFRNLLSFG
jgi:hypothetical protein